MKQVTSSLHWLLFVMALFVCIGSGAHAQSFSFRALHLVPGGPNVDVHFNNMPQATITNLGYEYVSSLAPTLPVGSGSVNVKVAPAGTGLAGAILNQDIAVQENYDYVAVAYSLGGLPKVKVLERMKTQLPTGANAFLRVLNLTTITNPASFDFYIDSTTSFARISELASEGVSPFITLRGDVKTLYITPTGSKTPIAQVVVPLTALARVTLILTGNSAENLKVYMMDGQNVESYQLPVLPIQGAENGVLSSVRVLHAWHEKMVQGSGIQALDVFVDNEQQPRGSNLKYRTASAKYGPFTTDSVTLKFTPHNEALSTIYMQKIAMERDTDYVVILTRSSEGAAAALLLKAPNTFPSSVTDSFYVRVAHVTDFHRNVTVKITPQGGTPITTSAMNFLTSTDWYAIPRGPFTVEAYRAGENAPFYTTTNPGTMPPSYLTLVALGDSATFQIDVLNEMMTAEQVFDPAASAPLGPVAGADILRLRTFPNPFAGTTTIGFSMPKAGRVTIAVFDAMGREVATVLDAERGEGEQSVTFDAAGLPAGAYIYRLSTGGSQTVGQMILAR